jgi:phosphatidylglycerophosphate synthase
MVLIVGRDVTLIVVSLFVRYTVLEKPVTFWKYVNLFGYARIRVKAHWISKLNTVIQLVLITITLPSRLFNYQDSILLILVQILTGVTTILSSIAYLVYRNGYEIINDKSF